MDSASEEAGNSQKVLAEARSELAITSNSLEMLQGLARAQIRSLVCTYLEQRDDLATQGLDKLHQLSAKYPAASKSLAEEYDLIFDIRAESLEIFDYKNIDCRDVKVRISSKPTLYNADNRVKPPVSLPPTVQNHDPSSNIRLLASPADPMDVDPITSDQTLGREIQVKQVMESQYWVFEYQLETELELWVLRCPHDGCPRPVFFKDPMPNDKALKHIERHPPYRRYNKRELVHNFATRVIPDRPGTKINRERMIEHNSSLLGKNEKQYEKYNLARVPRAR